MQEASHSISMTNNYHVNDDNSVPAKSYKHKEILMMNGAYQLSSRDGQWECNFDEGGGVKRDWRGPRPICVRFCEKRVTSRGIINFPASISTPESFLDTKAKCPLDVRMQCGSGSAAVWSSNLPFFRHRRT